MPPRWFRVAYARNAFLRVLSGSGLELGTLTPAAGARAMLEFCAGSRPQHGVVDELVCAWAPHEAGFEFSLIRRLQREHEPEAPLHLTFTIAGTVADSGSVVVGSLTEIRGTPGYRAIGRSAVVARRLAQVGPRPD